MMKNIILVGLGGMIGSVLRYLASLFIKNPHFPYATLTVNLVGSMFIGLIMGWAVKQPYPEFWRLLLVTGICGGFTTFSAFAWENFKLIQIGRYDQFLWYTGGSVILSLLAVALGFWFTK